MQCAINKGLIPDIQPQSGDFLSPDIVFSAKANENTGQYRISFEYYLEKYCEIDFLQEKAYCKKALQWLKQVGQCSDEDGIRSIAKQASDDAPVYNNNHYSFLFKKLPSYVETIREYKLSNKEGRLFYYIDPALKIVYCILIKNAHIETDKVKI